MDKTEKTCIGNVLSSVLLFLFRLEALFYHFLLRLQFTTSKSKEPRWPRDRDSVDGSKKRTKENSEKKGKTTKRNEMEEGNTGKMKWVSGYRKARIIVISFHLFFLSFFSSTIKINHIVDMFSEN